MMPCSDDGYSHQTEEMHDRKTIKLLSSLLCSACRELESKNYDFDKNPALSEWWAEHKRADEARELATLRNKLRREQAMEIAKTKTIAQCGKTELALLKEFKLI